MALHQKSLHKIPLRHPGAMPAITPFEDTTTFRICDLAARLAACDRLLDQTASLQTRRSALDESKAQLAHKEQTIDREHSHVLSVEKDRITDAEKRVVAARSALLTAQTARRAACERYALLEQRCFTSSDEKSIRDAITAKTATLGVEIAEAQELLSTHLLNENRFGAKLSELRTALDQALSDLEEFERGLVPSAYKQQHEASRRATQDALNREIASIEKCILDAGREKQALIQALGQTQIKLQEYRKRKANIVHARKQGNWFTLALDSLSELVGEKYEYRIAAAQRQGETLREKIASLDADLSKAALREKNFETERDTRLQTAAADSRTRLRGFCQEKVHALSQKVTAAEDQPRQTSDQVSIKTTEIKALEDDLKRLTAEAAEEAIANLRQAAEAEIESRSNQICKAEVEVAYAQGRHEQLLPGLSAREAELANAKAVALSEAKALARLGRSLIAADGRCVVCGDVSARHSSGG